MLISPPKSGPVLMKAYLCLRTVAKLAGPLNGVKDAGKVQNQRMEKLKIVLIVHVLLILVK